MIIVLRFEGCVSDCVCVCTLYLLASLRASSVVGARKSDGTKGANSPGILSKDDTPIVALCPSSSVKAKHNTCSYTTN